MQVIGLLLALLASGLACEKQQPPNEVPRSSAAVPTSSLPSKSAPSKSAQANGAGGNGEPDDVDDTVSVTDKSGAATPVSENAGSEGVEIELEE
jgi:hypothetical protein